MTTPTHITDADLAELERLLAETIGVIPGADLPWRFYSDGPTVVNASGGLVLRVAWTPVADLVVAGINALPSLVHRLRTSEARAEKAEAEVARLTAKYEARQFPIMDAPKSIPWALIEPWESQAQTNHRQSLATLAGRGGLDANEAYAVLMGKRWNEIKVLGSPDASLRLMALVNERSVPSGEGT